MEGALDDTRKGAWTVEEDEALCQAVLQHGTKNWTVIAAGIVGRSGKSCRLRWCNHLDPAVNKEPFSEWEAAVIIRAQAIHNNRWAAISRLLQGRTDNAVKNHWHATLSRKVASGSLRNRFLDEGVTLEWLLDNPEPGKVSPDAKALLAAARKAAATTAAGDASPRGPASSSTGTAAPCGPARIPAAREPHVAAGPRPSSATSGKWRSTPVQSTALKKKKRSRRQLKQFASSVMASPLAMREESDTPTSMRGYQFDALSPPSPSHTGGGHNPAALEDAQHVEGVTVVVKHVVALPEHASILLQPPQHSCTPGDVATTQQGPCKGAGAMTSPQFLEAHETAVSRSSDDSSCGVVLLPICGQHDDMFAAPVLTSICEQLHTSGPDAMVLAREVGSPGATAALQPAHCASGSESSSPMKAQDAGGSRALWTPPAATGLLAPTHGPGALQQQVMGSGSSPSHPVCDGVRPCPGTEPSTIHCQHSMASTCASWDRHVAQPPAGSSVRECCMMSSPRPTLAGRMASPTQSQCAATKLGSDGHMLCPPAHEHPSAELAGECEQGTVVSEEDEVEPSCRYLSLFNVELCSEARLARTVTTGSLSPTGSLRTWSGAQLEELTRRLGPSMNAVPLPASGIAGMSRCASVPVIAMADPGHCTFYATNGTPFSGSSMTRAYSCADMSLAATGAQARCMIPVGRSLPPSPRRSLHVRYAPYPMRCAPLGQVGPLGLRSTPHDLLPCTLSNSSPGPWPPTLMAGLPMHAHANLASTPPLHGCALRCRSLPSLAPLAEGDMLSAGLGSSSILAPGASLPLLGRSTYGAATVVDSPILACDTGLCPMPCDAPAPLNGTGSSALDALEAPSMDALAQMEAILLPEDVARDLLFL